MYCFCGHCPIYLNLNCFPKEWKSGNVSVMQ